MKAKQTKFTTKQLHKIVKELSKALTTIRDWENSAHLLEARDRLTESARKAKGRKKIELEIKADEMQELYDHGQGYLESARRSFCAGLKELKKVKV